MSKRKNSAENRDQPLPIRPTPTLAQATKRLVSLLTDLGLPVSTSELIRQITAPCFAPHLPYTRRPGLTTTCELANARGLNQLIGYRFFAGMLPLIEQRHAVVSVEPLTGEQWRLSIWVSSEYRLYQLVQELEKATCEGEKSAKSEKCGDATITPYLTRRERRALARRAKRATLKRTRESGESRMLRLVAAYALPRFLKEVEAEAAPQPKAGQPPPQQSAPTEQDCPNPS